MFIDESLSKGLRTDFWRLLADENKKLHAKLNHAFNSIQCDLTNKKNANKFFRSLDQAANSPIVLHREITGNRKSAVWWSAYLERDDSHSFNSWNEPALRFQSDRFHVHPGTWDPTWWTIIIGEHCIARLFQRLPWTSLPKPFDILPELRELALFCQWYAQADSVLHRSNEGVGVTVFMPTTNGAFLGRHNPQDGELIELRTFINKVQMSETQLSLWQKLTEAKSISPFGEYLGDLMRTAFDNRPELRVNACKACTPGMMAITNALGTHMSVLDVELVETNPSLRIES